jgi:hypothetical protein
MPIDLAQVDWFYVVVLAVFVFVATGIGNLLSFGRHGIGAVLSAVAFAARRRGCAGRTCRPDCSAAATQPDHRHHAACDTAVGLHPTVVLMFSPLQVGNEVLSHSGRSAAIQASGIVA